MRANAINLRRVDLFLRAVSAKAGWSQGVIVNAGDVATGDAGFAAATAPNLAEVLAYMVDQGWLVGAGVEGSSGFYTVTRHGLDEAQRKMPAEPKPKTGADQAG